MPGQTAEVRDGDELSFGGSRVEVIENPGHTLGAISFYMESQRRLFTGDTLFTAGCGRLFEGTPAQMWASLLRLRALPAETLVCCGHEYTEANLAFARHLEPENPAVAARQAQVQAQRERGEPTVPATLGLERETNPFLRADDPALLLALERLDGSRPEPGVAAFARLRARKDTF